MTTITHGPATMHLGDCLEIMKSIPDQSIDLVLADLPYGTTQNKWDSLIPLQPLWKEYLRICRGAFVLTAQTPFDKVLGASNLAMLRYEWIWEKSNPTGHLNAKKAPMKAHENVLVFSRGQTIYNPIKTTGHKRKTAVRRECKSTNYGEQKFDPITYDSTERYPRSVLPFPSDKQKSNRHPTQKPVALMEYMVRTYSHPGQTVLDNCFGSATTAVACLRSGRKFIGIEIEEAYFWDGCERVREVYDPLWRLNSYSKEQESDSKMPKGLQSEDCNPLISLDKLAEWTGLEPATPGVTGRCQKP